MKTVIPWIKQCLYWLLFPFLGMYTLLIRIPLWLLFTLCYPAGLRVLGLNRGQITELQEEWDDWSKEEIDRDVF